MERHYEKVFLELINLNYLELNIYESLKSYQIILNLLIKDIFLNTYIIDLNNYFKMSTIILIISYLMHNHPYPYNFNTFNNLYNFYFNTI